MYCQRSPGVTAQPLASNTWAKWESLNLSNTFNGQPYTDWGFYDFEFILVLCKFPTRWLAIVIDHNLLLGVEHCNQAIVIDSKSKRLISAPLSHLDQHWLHWHFKLWLVQSAEISTICHLDQIDQHDQQNQHWLFLEWAKPTLIWAMALPARQTSPPSTTVTSCPMFFTSSFIIKGKSKLIYPAAKDEDRSPAHKLEWLDLQQRTMGSSSNCQFSFLSSWATIVIGSVGPKIGVLGRKLFWNNSSSGRLLQFCLGHGAAIQKQV